MDHPGRPRGGRLPDPGMGATCGRCGEPREAHGGPGHLGACPGESGIQAKRFSVAPEDRPQPDPAADERDRLPLPPLQATGPKTPDEIGAMIERLDDNIREHGWDASVDAAMQALEWALGATWPDLDRYMERPDAARRAEWLARGGDPQHWPDTPTR